MLSQHKQSSMSILSVKIWVFDQRGIKFVSLTVFELAQCFKVDFKAHWTKESTFWFIYNNINDVYLGHFCAILNLNLNYNTFLSFMY